MTCISRDPTIEKTKKSIIIFDDFISATPIYILTVIHDFIDYMNSIIIDYQFYMNSTIKLNSPLQLRFINEFIN